MTNFMLYTCYRGEIPQLNKYIYIYTKKKKKERKANIISNIGKQCFLRLETIHGCLLSTFLPKIKPEV